MPKKPETKRIEVHLMPDVAEGLITLAKLANRSLKNYIENMLIEHEKMRNKKIEKI